MNPAIRMSGVLSPVVTPFRADLSVDADALVQQCRWLLSQDTGLAVFGTNSEANSLSVAEKIEALEALVDAGIDTARMMPGTGCCALPDSVALTRAAASLGCAGTLMLPPFYYKGVSDDALYRSYSEIIQRVGDEKLRVYLYHIPPVAQVGISMDLIERLLRDYPGTIAGIKDSSGDWSNAAAMHARQWDDFQIFVGTEALLLENMRAGGAGCISATANVNPAAIVDLYRNWQSADADVKQQALSDLRGIVQQRAMIPALKAIVAHYSGKSEWRTVRPPLLSLTDQDCRDLIAALDAQNFAMPGLATND
ncbi:MAG: dihydrodipicolinate synthase family protein [Woeseia sp.]